MLIQEHRTARLGHLSHGSRECFDNTMDHLRDHFKRDRLISRIERRHAERFMSSLSRRDGRDGPLSSHSRAQILKYSRAIFTAAVEWGYISRNPFAPAAPGGSTPLRVKGKSRPWHHLTPDEFSKFLAVVPTARQRALYWLMYGCGLRPGEAYNLTINNIDLEIRRVYIENRVATESSPPFSVKAESSSSDSKERSVPIPEAAIPDITAAVEGAFKAGGFIALSAERYKRVRRNWQLCRQGKAWSETGQHRPWENRDMVNNVLRETKRYLRKAGVSLTAPFTLTTFRKSFGQNHADHGTPARTLARLLGHSDVAITMEFYNRVTDANELAAAKTIDRMFAKITPATTTEKAG